jgi:tetratricopeptide (TPR) repeat protein
MVSLATSLLQEDHNLEAEKLLREALEVQRRILGLDHRDIGASTYELAILEEREGKNDEALGLLREAIDHGLSLDDSLGIETDPDLKSLHADPRFTALVAETKKRAAAAVQKSR